MHPLEHRAYALELAFSPVNEEPPSHRERALRALHIYFTNRRWPRLMMSGILVITGGAGFLASFCMLKAGMTQMWMRYPLAVLLAWVALLGLLRLWAAVERRCFQPDDDLSAVLEAEEASSSRRVLRESKRSSRDWSDALVEIRWPSLDCDEGCLPGLLLAIVLALLAAVFAVAVGVVMGAPLLIADVFLDAILVAALFKKVRGLEPRCWLASAVRKTAVPVLLTVILLMIGGAIFHSLDPDGRSIGQVWRTVKGDPPQKDGNKLNELEK